MMCTGLMISMTAATMFAVAGVPAEMFSDWDKVGLVSVLILGIIALYKDGAERQRKFDALIEKTLVALEKNTQATQRVEETIKGCKSWDGHEMRHHE